jgi:HK97 family phage major capsid protein
VKYADVLRDKVAKLTEERAALKAEADTLVADETRSADDIDARVDEIIARSTELKAEIETAEKRAAELDALEAERAAAVKPSLQLIVKPEAPATADVSGLSRMQARDAAMRVIEAQPSYMVSDENRAHVEKLIATRSKDCDGDVIAKRLLVTESDAYRSAWVKAVTQDTPAFTSEEARAINELRNMSIGTDAAGGFGVPVLIDPTIILTSGAADAAVLSLARVVTITNDEWRGVSSPGVSWSFDAENAAASNDSPTLAQPLVVAHMAQGFIPYSIEVGMDYPSFAAEMSGLLAQGYTDLLASVTVTGTGTGQPFGIFTALDANTNVEIVVTTDGAFGAVDIDRVWAALPERYRARATWLMNVDVENEIRAFGSGTATSRFTVDQSAGGISRLNGRPVALTDYAPLFTGTTGASNILVVGDFSNYVVAQRAGLNVELIPHLFDVTNNRPTGTRGWFAWARVGADSVNDLGFRVLQNT